MVLTYLHFRILKFPWENAENPKLGPIFSPESGLPLVRFIPSSNSHSAARGSGFSWLVNNQVNGKCLVVNTYFRKIHHMIYQMICLEIFG